MDEADSDSSDAAEVRYEERIEPMRSINSLHPNGSAAIPAPCIGLGCRIVRWSEDIFAGETVVYLLSDPGRCLGPPVERDDEMLRFDSRFEAGNLWSAAHMRDRTYHLELEHDSTGATGWFFFQVSNTHVGNDYSFILTGFRHVWGIFEMGYRVFFHSARMAAKAGLGWRRGGMNYRFGALASGGFALKFDIEMADDDTVLFAYGPPYTYSDLLEAARVWMKSWFFRSDVLCTSRLGRMVPRFTLGTGASVVVLTARCHPGESVSSVVLHGAIDFLLRHSEILSRFRFEVVPMICVDGVVEGRYRVDPSGSDLNRQWREPDAARHPTVAATRELLQALKPRAFVDFHGHSRMLGSAVYACTDDKIFTKMLAKLVPSLNVEQCQFAIPERRATAARCVVHAELGVADSFCIETSFAGYRSGASYVPYCEASWRDLGGRVVEALVEYLAPSGCSRLRQSVEAGDSGFRSHLPRLRHAGSFGALSMRKRRVGAG